MVDLSTDRERVLNKVIEEPGLPVAAIEWKLAQEGFGLSFEGKATVTLTYEMLQKFKKVSSRLTDLKNAHKVKQEFNNRGYYPDVGASPSVVAKQASFDQARNQQRQVTSYEPVLRVDPSVAGVSSARECMALLGEL